MTRTQHLRLTNRIAKPLPVTTPLPESSAWQDALDSKSALQNELKRRSMIFDCELKERVAVLAELPFDAYHELSHAEWVKVKQAYYARFDGREERQT